MVVIMKFSQGKLFDPIPVISNIPSDLALFARLISHQPAVLFSQNKPATSNQPAVLFSQNKPAPAISHQPTEQADLCQLVTLGQELANRSSNFFQSQPDIISALCFVGYFAYSLLGVKF
jgi:hypothetical protein